MYRQSELESVARYLDMSPVRVKAEHKDWMRLKDVDAAHDFVFIRRILEKYIGGLFPSNIADSIKGFEEHLWDSPAVKNIPTIYDIAERINAKIERVQKIIKDKGYDYKLERIFHESGLLSAEPNEDEDLEMAVADSQRYLEKAEKQRRNAC
jgi:hypothetical protein